MDIKTIVNARNYQDNNANSNYAGRLKTDYEKWLDRFHSNLKGDTSKSTIVASLKDKSFLVKLFFYKNRGGVSRSLYYLVRAHIIALADFYNTEPNIPLRDEVLSSQSITSMYKDLDSILRLIEDVKVGKLESKKDLLNIKVISILGWYGLSLNRITSLKRRDVLEGNLENIPKKYLSIIKEFATSVFYKNPEITKDDFLFITSGSGEPVASNTIVAMLRDFNNSISTTMHVIVFTNLRKNALFVEIYSDEQSYKNKKFTSAELRSKIVEKFSCDQKVAFGFALEYKQWKKTTYNN